MLDERIGAVVEDQADLGDESPTRLRQQSYEGNVFAGIHGQPVGTLSTVGRSLDPGCRKLHRRDPEWSVHARTDG